MKKLIALICMTMFLGIFLLSGGVAAFDSGDIGKLKTTNQCPSCNLSGANLSNAILRWANLSYTDLGGADLSNAILNGANLRNTILREANLAGANLGGADLSGTTWTDGSFCKQGSIGMCR
ncbi:MAG: pentapeptide repeat-containing protein [Syntrophales bacterium]|nr:pentapeptide repeat-containing protein [Syntrophales bacterium]